MVGSTTKAVCTVSRYRAREAKRGNGGGVEGIMATADGAYRC